MSKVGAETLAKAGKRALGRNEINCRSLVHSAFDLSEDLYDFATWITDESFVTTMNAQSTEKNTDVRKPGLDIRHPIAFADFNGDNKCMGIGLKSLKELGAKEEVLRVKT